MLRDTAYRALSALGAPALSRRLAPPAGLILMGHSVAESSPQPFDPNRRWRVSCAQLEAAIITALAMGYVPATLDEAARHILQGSDGPPFFVVTFDDGYADNLTAALPVCRRHGVPLTVYVTSGFVRRAHVAWWHMLEHLIRHHERLTLRLPDAVTDVECATPYAKQAVYSAVARTLTLADAAVRAAFADDARERYGAASATYASSLFLTADQLRKLGSNNDVEIGVHGVSHSALKCLSREQAERELQDAATDLATMTGHTPRHLAFPFGTAAAVSQREFALSRAQGFVTAVTTRHGCVTPADRVLQQLPRLPLFPDDTPSTLSCKFSGLTTALLRAPRGPE